MPEVTQAPQNMADYSEQEQIRRDKLQAMMAEGNNPYLITKYDVCVSVDDTIKLTKPALLETNLVKICLVLLIYLINYPPCF